MRPVLDVLAPVSIAVALALLLDPTIDRLQRRGLSRGTAIGLVSISFVAAIVVLTIFLAPILVKQAKELAENMPGHYRKTAEAVNQMVANNAGFLHRTNLPTTLEDLIAKYSPQIESGVRNVFTGAGLFFAGMLSKVIWIVMIPIITVFLLIDIDRLKQKALLFAPEKYREETATLASSIGRVFGSYIRGLFTVAIIYGIACGLALAAWRVPYSLMLGAAAGALSLVPYIGTISTLLLVSLMAFASSPGHPLNALWVAATLLILNQLFDNAVSPKLVGKAVGIHPALAIVALLIGGRMFGLGGMILSVPVAASIQIIVLEFCPQFRDLEPEKKPSGFGRWIQWRKGVQTKQAADNPNASGAYEPSSNP